MGKRESWWANKVSENFQSFRSFSACSVPLSQSTLFHAVKFYDEIHFKWCRSSATHFSDRKLLGLFILKTAKMESLSLSQIVFKLDPPTNSCDCLFRPRGASGAWTVAECILSRYYRAYSDHNVYNDHSIHTNLTIAGNYFVVSHSFAQVNYAPIMVGNKLIARKIGGRLITGRFEANPMEFMRFNGVQWDGIQSNGCD